MLSRSGVVRAPHHVGQLCADTTGIRRWAVAPGKLSGCVSEGLSTRASLSTLSAVVDATAVQEALANLAARLVTPVDFITIHRANKDEAKRNPQYRSMRYGAFLQAYGPF